MLRISENIKVGIYVTSIVIFFLLLVGCGKRDRHDAAKITPNMVKNSEYYLQDIDTRFKLVNGHYEAGDEGVDFIKAAFGDLNNDGIKDAAVILAYSGGGSGYFFRLAAVINRNGHLYHIATASLGDRIIINSLQVKSGRIIIDMYDHRRDEGMASASLRKIVSYKLSGDRLVPASKKKSQIAYRKARWSWQASFDYFVNVQYSDDGINWVNASPCGHVRFRERMDDQYRMWDDVGSHKYWALHICGIAGTPPFEVWEMDWFTHDGTTYVEENPTANEISIEGSFSFFKASNLIDNDLNTLGLRRNASGTSEARVVISR